MSILETLGFYLNRYLPFVLYYVLPLAVALVAGFRLRKRWKLRIALFAIPLGFTVLLSYGLWVIAHKPVYCCFEETGIADPFAAYREGANRMYDYLTTVIGLLTSAFAISAGLFVTEVVRNRPLRNSDDEPCGD